MPLLARDDEKVTSALVFAGLVSVGSLAVAAPVHVSVNYAVTPRA
jgi:hypothetical protein